jgi:hypothetical protein
MSYTCLYTTKYFQKYEQVIRKETGLRRTSTFFSDPTTTLVKKRTNLQNALFIMQLCCVGQRWATLDTTRTTTKELAKETGNLRSVITFDRRTLVENIQIGEGNVTYS